MACHLYYENNRPDECFRQDRPLLPKSPQWRAQHSTFENTGPNYISQVPTKIPSTYCPLLQVLYPKHQTHLTIQRLVLVQEMKPKCFGMDHSTWSSCSASKLSSPTLRPSAVPDKCQELSKHLFDEKRTWKTHTTHSKACFSFICICVLYCFLYCFLGMTTNGFYHRSEAQKSEIKVLVEPSSL